ncbi:hypothetical protein PR202_ga20158 [Eleusine coracana subsp. coracana]|uniref:Uncharacterized protein n=1 Tax=Eleusine coracana subsp. coracana TaxID=191504 RepID=A0AAV5CVW8_ELECO|nr:hypothetical protein PR202_ga20158 [Eleusine coracana subsp. coracana]
MDAVKAWVAANYEKPMASMQHSLQAAYVVFSFCAAFFIGGIKGTPFLVITPSMVVGPVAAALMILGNVGVILLLFPAHVWWTIYSLIKTDSINTGLKLAVFMALPVLFGLWLGLGIFGSALVALGYGFFTPWISTFEAFRQESERKKFVHGIVVRQRFEVISCTTRRLELTGTDMTRSEQDGTWGTIKGSCTVVRDFADLCFHSYPVYLKELRQSSQNCEPHSIRLLDVPSCIIVGLLGLVVDIPLYTVIALIKSPYMLFKGWQRLLHDLISREGPFLETVCVPIAGLAILFWPLVVVGSVLLAIVSSIFVGLYGAVIVYQENSFRRGVSYVVAMVAEFDEYTNDWLYLREGTVLPKYHISLTILILNVLIYFIVLFFLTLAGSGGLLLGNGFEVNQHNRPQDRLLDWVFHPVLVLKEQIQALNMTEEEVRFLEKLTLFIGNPTSASGWDNGAAVPQDPVRTAQIQAISRRLVGIVRSLSKFPTYRRRFRHVVKLLVAYSIEREGSSASSHSVSFFEITQLEV